MELDLHRLTGRHGRLPSLPTVIVQLLELINSGEADIQNVSLLLAHDPALAGRLLRFANSPLYARTDKIENLRRAVVTLGLNATLNVALSVSLAPTITQGDGTQDHGRRLNYPQVWRRALLAATSALELGNAVRETAPEELFLAALLQDIGMLAIDKLDPEFYRDLGDAQQYHDQVQAYERERLGEDHAHVGARLLKHWNLAERTVLAVHHSHDLDRLPTSGMPGKFLHCAALSGWVSDFLLGSDSETATFDHLASCCSKQLGLTRRDFEKTILRISRNIPELEKLFDFSLITDGYPMDILERVNETLTTHNLSNLRAIKKREDLVSASDLAQDEAHNIDPLTGLFARDFLDRYLPNLLEIAQRGGQPLTMILLEVCHYHDIKKQVGPAAERLLSGIARILERNVRGGDLAVRYNSDSLAVLLPGAGSEAGENVCTRFLKSCGALELKSRKGVIHVSLCAGVATHGEELHFERAQDLMEAVDSALHAARLAGDNRISHYVQADRMPE